MTQPLTMWSLDDGDGIALPIEILSDEAPDFRLVFYDQKEQKHYAIVPTHRYPGHILYELVEVEII